MGGFIPGGGIGTGGGSGTPDNTTDERIPYKSGTEFDDSPLYFDVSEEKVVSDVTLEVPPGTIIIGETTDLSACTGTLIVTDRVNSEFKYIVESKFDTTGSSQPDYLDLEDEYVLDVQTTFTETLTDNPLTYSVTGSVDLPAVRQINTTTFKTGAILTNLRARFIDNSTGIVMRYIPSKADWDANTGVTTISGDNLFNFLSDAADTAGVFNLGINPFLVEFNQQIDIEIEADSINILGNLSGEPYQVANVQDGPYITLADKETADRHQTTGILEGGVVSEATTTTVNWTSGRGIVADYSDPENPVVTDVTWDAVNGYTPTNIATDGTTLFGYNSAGVLQEKLSTAVVISDSHDIIWFGSVTHLSSVIVTTITAPGNIGYDGIGSFSDFINLVIGPANVDGNVYGPNGTNLKIDVVGGNAYMLGSNFRTDTKLSDIVTLGNGTAVNFSDVYRSAGAGLSVIYSGSTDLIDPTKYDDGSGTLATVTSGYWTIQRIFRSRTGSTFVAYGQQEFSSKALALESKGDEPFTEKSPLPFMLYRCSLAVGEGATDLSDTDDAEFFSEASFRAGGAQSTSSTIPGITSPGGSDKSVQYNDSNTFGGDTYFTYDSSTRKLGLKSILAGTTLIDLTNSSDVSKGTITYNESTDEFSIDSSNEIIRIGSGVHVHSGSADNRLDIEAETNTGSAELTLSKAGGGTGLMIDYDDNTDEGLISCEEGPLTISTAMNEEIRLTLGGSTAKVSILNATSPDTNEIIIFTTGGTNSGTARIYIGSRTPEGNVTANGGSLYIRDDGTDSELYLKRTDGATTGWVDFLHSASGVQGPVSSTDNAFVLWDGTTGLLIKDSPITFESTATLNAINVFSPSITGEAAYFLNNNAGDLRGILEYKETTGLVRLLSTSSDLDLQTTGNLNLSTTGSTESVTIDGSNLPDTLNLLVLDTGGTNGGVIGLHVGARNPEGLITADGGALYFRDAGVNSDLYIKRTDGGNTGWTDFIHSESGVKGPASSTDNAFVLWDGTTGGIIKDSPITFESTATLNAINVFSPSATGESAYFLDNSSGDIRGIFEYKETTGLVRILATSSDLELQTTGDLNISTTGSTESVTIDGSNLPDTLNLLVLDTGGANGGVIGLHVGARNPEGLITANGGAIYFRDAGTSSDLYIKRTDGGNTGWTDFLHSVSGVQGPATSTDNGIPIWNGTTGTLLKDTPITIESDSSNTVIYIESPSVTGKAEVILTDSNSDARTIFEYIESSGLSRILATDSDLDIVTNGDMIIQIQGLTKSLTIDGSNSPDTQELLSFDTGGTNGAVVDLYVGIRNPEGNITALDGALYFRKDGVASNIFRHESIGSSASGWVPLVGGDNGGSTDKSIPIWNGTDSDSLSNEPNARIQQTGGIFKLELEAPLADDTVRFELLDSSSVSASFWQFNDNTKLTLMLAEAGDLEVGSQNNDAIVSVNSATSEIRLEGFILPDTQNLLTFSTQGANGADANIFVGTRNPNENITGVPGDHYLRTNGIDSAEYIQTDSGSSTAWSKIMVDSDTNAFGGFGRYQNLLLWSEDLTGWVLTNATVTPNNVTAPNGTLTADTIAWTTVGRGLRQNVTLTDAATYTASFWARNTSGNDTLTLNAGGGTPVDVGIDSTVVKRYSVQLVAGTFDRFDFWCNTTIGTFELWGINLVLGTEVTEYAKTGAFAATTADYGLSIAGNLRTDFAEIVSEASGSQNTFRVKTGTFGSYIVLADGSDFDNITIECYEDGAQSNISLDALTKSEIRSSSAAFEIKSNSNSVDLKTGGNDTIPPLTIEAEGTNGAKIQLFASTRSPIGNVTGEPGDNFNIKSGVDSASYTHEGASSNNSDWKKNLTETDNLNVGTGVLTGGTLSINGGDDSLLDVTSGSALIADYSTLGTPSIKTITWAGQTIDPDLSTSWNKWVGVQESATPGIGEFVFDVEFTQLEKRTIAIVGRCWGDGITDTIIGKGQYTTPGFGQAKIGEDLSYSIGSFNKNGNVYSSNGANLLLNKTSGNSYRFSAGWATSPQSPNVHVDASQTAISSYYYHLQAATSADIQTDIDPDNYDLAGSKTAVPTGMYTLQRLYYFPVSQVLMVTYGQEVFSSMADAVGHAGEDEPVLSNDLLEGSILRGWLAVKQGITSLNPSVNALFTKATSLNEPHTDSRIGSTLITKSYSMGDYGTDDISFVGGFYEFSVTDVTLTIGGTVTEVFGDSLRALGAHAYCVASGPGGTDLVLTVSGASITDAGVRNGSDSEILVADTDAATTNQYFETTKKWLGQVTYTLTGAAGSFTFNYGVAKYDDFGDRVFTVTEFEVVGKASANAANLTIRLLHHSPSGWAYNATAFNSIPSVIANMSSDYSPDKSIHAGGYFAYKRTDLSTVIDGTAQEGIVIDFGQNTNNALYYANYHVGVLA